MPSVASDVKTHAPNSPVPQAPLPLPASNHAPPSPFETLLDDGARVAAQPSTRPPPERGKTAKAEHAESDRPTTRGKDSKPAKRGDRAKTADTGKSAKGETTATNAKTTATTEQTATIETAGEAGGTDKIADGLKVADAKADGDDTTKTDAKKPDSKTDAHTDAKIDPQVDTGALPATDTVKPTVVAAAVNVVAAAVNTVPDPVPADSALAPSKDPTTVAAPAPDSTATPTSAPTTVPVAAAVVADLAPADEPVKLATPITQQADVVSADAPKDKPAALLSAQANAGKPADVTDKTKASDEDAQTGQGDGRPQATIDTSGKQAVARARGEIQADSHRASKVDASQPAPNATAAKPSIDVLQTLAVNPPPHNAAATAANATPAVASTLQLAAQTPVPLAGVAIAIAGRALEGKNQFEIRLDPPELGRIEVRLDVDRDGQVTSHLIAHRADTLDLLRRDAAGLQRALQDAGLKTADNGLQFSLHDQSTGRQQDMAGSKTAQLVVQDETPNPVEPTPSGYYAQLARLRGGLDIKV